MTKRLKLLVLCGVLTCLQACSVFEPKPASLQEYDWPEIQSELVKLSSWELLGKINIRTPDDSVTAAINSWKQEGEHFSVDLSSTFLGLGATNISGTSRMITLTETGETPLVSDEPDQLIADALGLPLPITHLQSWIRAIPYFKTKAEISFAPNGLPSTFKQDGWDIEFSRFTFEHSFPLPEKIKITRSDIRITIVLKQWNLLP